MIFRLGSSARLLRNYECLSKNISAMNNTIVVDLPCIFKTSYRLVLFCMDTFTTNLYCIMFFTYEDFGSFSTEVYSCLHKLCVFQ